MFHILYKASYFIDIRMYRKLFSSLTKAVVHGGDRYSNVIDQARVIWVKVQLISHLLLVCCFCSYEDPLFHIFIDA